MFEFNISKDVKITIDQFSDINPLTMDGKFIDTQQWTVRLHDLWERQMEYNSAVIGIVVGSPVYKIITDSSGTYIRYPRKDFFTTTKREWLVDKDNCYLISDIIRYIALPTPIYNAGDKICGFICDSGYLYFPKGVFATALGRVISKKIVVLSESNPTKSYEVLNYTDGSYSCNCPAWTKRISQAGTRYCKHIRKIESTNA